MAEPRKVFPSKRDGWLTVVLVASACAPLLIGAVLVFQAATRGAAWTEVLPALGVLALVTPLTSLLPSWTAKSTYYVVTPKELLVRSGPFRWTIPVTSIREVTPSRSPASSPALSLDRLCIARSPGRSLLVSPADKAGFLAALVGADPGLRLDGNRLSR